MRSEVLLLLLVVGCTAVQPTLNNTPTQHTSPPNASPSTTNTTNTTDKANITDVYPVRENGTNLTLAVANTQDWVPPTSGAILHVSDGRIGVRFWLPQGKTVTVPLSEPVNVSVVLVSTDGRVIVSVDGERSQPLRPRELVNLHNNTVSLYASDIIVR